MKKSLILVAAFGMLLFASCKNTEQNTDANVSTETNSSATPVDDHAGHDHGAPGDDHAGHNHGTPSENTTSTSTAGLNPPHGEPGHRCDIAVGAPLDSPAQQMAPPTAAAPAQSNGSGPFLVNDEAKNRIQQENGGTPAAQPNGRVNPPHGQPGHVCG